MSIGQRICKEMLEPTTEDISVIRQTDRDVRQDAALDLLRNFQANGVEVNDDTLIDVIDEHGALANHTLRIAWAAMLRKQNGRNPQTREQRATVRLQHDDTELPIEDAEDKYERVDVVPMPRVRERYERGNDAEKQAILLMVHIQQLKACGYPVSPKLRKKVSRYRQQTGLPLNVNLV